MSETPGLGPAPMIGRPPIGRFASGLGLTAPAPVVMVRLEGSRSVILGPTGVPPPIRPGLTAPGPVGIPAPIRLALFAMPAKSVIDAGSGLPP